MPRVCSILGVGYTIYPGSELEAAMFAEAARLIFEAHQYGLVTVIWAYPRGHSVAKRKIPISHRRSGGHGGLPRSRFCQR